MSGFGDPPPGFRDALHTGDCAYSRGLLASAAAWYSQAYDLGCDLKDDRNARHWTAKAAMRLDLLAASCFEPRLGKSSSRDDADRWAALRTLAERRHLTWYCTAGILYLVGMLRRPSDPRTGSDEESDLAWGVLLACRPLVAPVFAEIDLQLIAEEMHRHRAELALHPAATADIWLAMLKRWRTPDLVHTLWEMPRAMEDVRIRAALR